MAFHDPSQCNYLSDGRLHLQHGPIDLIIEAFGATREVEAAYLQASDSFTTVLVELVSELNDLRKQHGTSNTVFTGKIAIEMANVAKTFAYSHLVTTATQAQTVTTPVFVTPMIAVAGAVADHVLHSMISGRRLSKAYVNNGGDIAIYLSDTQSFNVGVCTNPINGNIISTATIHHDTDIRGIATSGWRGRSHSLGIADSVTVLARNSAIADAAATLIANAVDLPEHPAIKRQPANELQPDSDLRDQLVTVEVGELSSADINQALVAGQALARSMIGAEQIVAVYASLNSQVFTLAPDGFDRSQMRPGNDQPELELACA